MAHIGLLLFQLCLCFYLSSSRKHECDRLCLANDHPKTCYYKFAVGFSRGYDRNANRRAFLSINGESPGPLISVCQNDSIVVDVTNSLPSGMETSLHWHGLSEGNSPFMDGVPMITQCPILPRTTFEYRLNAAKPGTFFYHAHSVAQQLDGIYGPLIVRDAKGQSQSGKTVVVAPQMKSLQVLDDSYEADLNVTGFRVDVFADFFVEDKSSGNVPQLLRVINAAALDCPIMLFTHIVPLKIIAVDGNNIKPVKTSDVVINPGERIDLLVKPEVMEMTHIVGHNLCKGHAKYGFDPGISEKNVGTAENKNFDSAEMILKLESENGEKLKKGDVRVFLSFDGALYPRLKGDVDFRYKLGAVVPYVPSILSRKSLTTVLQFHNKSFLYPPSPFLSQPEDLPEDIICHSNDVSENCEPNKFCECLQIVDLPYNYNVDLFIIDEGKHNNISQTFHIHGYSFYVLSVKSFEKPISAFEVWEKEIVGEIKRKLVSPAKKDTISVPNKGFVALRLRTDNPGKWLLESSTSKARTGYGLEVILNVENPNEKLSPPEGFPKCGNKKEPDMVFTDD